MSITLENRYVIRSEDWDNCKYQVYKDQQLTLAILQDKGAPVKGGFYLEADVENFEWERQVDPQDGADIFYVKRKINGN